jgi:hypothetical protein
MKTRASSVDWLVGKSELESFVPIRSINKDMGNPRKKVAFLSIFFKVPIEMTKFWIKMHYWPAHFHFILKSR